MEVRRRFALLVLPLALQCAVAISFTSTSISVHHASNTSSPCSGMLSNHGEAASVLPVVQPERWPGATAFVEWCRNYSAIMRLEDAGYDQLVALHRHRGVWDWSEHLYHNRPVPHNSPMGTTFGDHLQLKSHVLHSLEVQMELRHSLLLPGMSLLDVGGGTGALGAYLMAVHGVRVVVLEVPFTSQCEAFLASPFTVQFFAGPRLPVPPRSYDAVSFMSMLHHAAHRTASLLEQAAAIARRWILVIEDLDVISNRKALQLHDGNGNFRSETEWTALLRERCPGFALVRQGRLQLKRKHYPHGRHAYYVGVAAARSEYQAFFVLERQKEKQN